MAEGSCADAERGDGRHPVMAGLGLLEDGPEEGAATDAENGIRMDLFGVVVAERACTDAGRVDGGHPCTASQNIVAVVESIAEGSRDGRSHGTTGRVVVVDAAGTVFDAENRVGIDLFGIEVAERAFADAGRGDGRHPGTAGQDLFRHVVAVEASLAAVSEERGAEHNRCHNMAG